MEIVKTQSVRPGREIFFYRDQNGVEIDFVIDGIASNRLQLLLIEAKASERVKMSSLHFSKVAPLLEKALPNCSVTTIVAANTTTKQALLIDDVTVFNPLYISLNKVLTAA